MDPVWDIRDRCAVTLPYEGEMNGEDLLKATPFRQDVEIDRYERAVRAMPVPERGRFLRSMETADVIVAIVRHGLRLGLTAQ